MKKVLFCLMLLCSVCSFAQQEAPKEGTHRVYCELLGQGKLFSSKINVTVDFGQAQSFWTGNAKGCLVDDKGNTIDFNSMVDAMNYMGTLGWRFVQAYVVTVSNQNVYHWLLYKDISEDEAIKAGIKTVGDVGNK
jgi:hypothetical protein